MSKKIELIIKLVITILQLITIIFIRFFKKKKELSS